MSRIFIMDYRSAIKRNEVRMNLKIVMLTGRSQTQKYAYCMVHPHKILENRLVCSDAGRPAWGQGWGLQRAQCLLQAVETPVQVVWTHKCVF